MRKYITILLLCFLPLSLLAQSGVSTSLFTGRMSYTIPIYSIEDPDFNLDIALRYSSEGFKPFQPSGCYGQDWSLIAGGCITRQVMGIPDEAIYYNERLYYSYKNKEDYKNDIHEPGKSFRVGTLNRGYAYVFKDKNPYAYLKDSCRTKENVFDFKLTKFIYADSLGIYNHRVLNDAYGGHNYMFLYDYMPDIFHFDFCGHKGSFIINNQGKAVILSGDFVDITLSTSYNSTSNVYFSRGTTHKDKGEIVYPKKSMELTESTITIKTTDGYSYSFGVIERRREIRPLVYEYYYNGSLGYSVPVNKNGFIDESVPIINAWYLAEIHAPNGRAIAFRYKRNKDDEFPNNLCSFVTGYDWTKDGNDSHISYGLQRDCMLDSIIIPDSIPLTISFISSPEEKKMYERSDYAWGCMPHLQLNSIVVKGGERVLRRAHLSYSYITKGHRLSGTSHWRYLSQVEISGYGKYNMSYNNSRSEIDLYPQTNEDYKGMVDRFGYWLDSPTQGMLSKVTLPTGGQINFYYGTHEYCRERCFKKYNCYCDVKLEFLSKANTPIGGVRIEKIETYSDANTLAETQTFTYKKANTSNSSGIYYNIYEIYDNPSCPYFDGKEKVQITHPYNYDMITSHIGYSYVEQETAIGSEKSKTTFSFDTGTENYVSYAYRGSYNQSNKWINFKGVDGWRAAEELRSGSLMYAGILKAPGKMTKTESFEGDRKVKSVQFRYNNGATRTTGYNGVSETVNALGIVDTIVCLSTYSAHVARKLLVCPDVLEKITTQEFDANGQMMENVQNITYDRKLRKKTITTTDSRGLKRFVKYTYREEVPDSLYMEDRSMYKSWLRDYACLMNSPIETITGYVENNKEYITSGVVILYGKKDYYSDFSASIWSLKLAEPLPAANYHWLKQSSKYGECDPNYTLSKEYKYNEKYHLIWEKPYGKTETTYTWKGLYPVTKTKDNQTWQYEYIPYVGIKSVTDPHGNIIKYEYDKDGRKIKESQVIDGKEQILNVYQYHIKAEYL